MLWRWDIASKKNKKWSAIIRGWGGNIRPSDIDALLTCFSQFRANLCIEAHETALYKYRTSTRFSGQLPLTLTLREDLWKYYTSRKLFKIKITSLVHHLKVAPYSIGGFACSIVIISLVQCNRRSDTALSITLSCLMVWILSWRLSNAEQTLQPIFGRFYLDRIIFGNIVKLFSSKIYYD